MKWDLSQMFSKKSFEEYYNEIENNIEILKLKANFTSKSEVLNLLKVYFKTLEDLEHIAVYSHQLLDENHKDDNSNSLYNKIKNLETRFSSESAYIEVELLALDDQSLNEFKNDMVFSEFHAFFKDLVRSKKHTLSAKEERILSLSAPLQSAPYEIYSSLTNADLQFNDVLDQTGAAHKFCENDWGKIARGDDRVLRENAFNTLMGTYGSFNNTFTTLYLSEINADVFSVTARNFVNTREKRLFENHIDEKCYDDLLKGVNANLTVNHQYMNLRKKVLGVDELHLYDMYVPLISAENSMYEFSEGVELINEALGILGETYVEDMKQAYTQKWIDVYPNEGKRSGAYSSGSYQSYPYILLNYDKTLNDVFTLAHELGHSMHSYYSRIHNNFYEAKYKIFVAEIASTTNELLLTFHMLNQDISKDKRAYLLNNLLEQFRTTVFRQTMFAEFEYESHKLVESNASINAGVLNALYFDLNKKYFGENVVIDDVIKFEWSRIPHFYFDYYVYQYATSFLAAVSVSRKIFNKDEVQLEKYLKFLQTGDSLKPLDAVMALGIDMRSDDYINEALSYFNEILEEFETLVA